MRITLVEDFFSVWGLPEKRGAGVVFNPSPSALVAKYLPCHFFVLSHKYGPSFQCLSTPTSGRADLPEEYRWSDSDNHPLHHVFFRSMPYKSACLSFLQDNVGFSLVSMFLPFSLRDSCQTPLICDRINRIILYHKVSSRLQRFAQLRRLAPNSGRHSHPTKYSYLASSTSPLGMISYLAAIAGCIHCVPAISSNYFCTSTDSHR